MTVVSGDYKWSAVLFQKFLSQVKVANCGWDTDLAVPLSVLSSIRLFFWNLRLLERN